jgi:hypothetical protein
LYADPFNIYVSSQAMELLNASTVVAVPEMGCSLFENGKQMAGNIAVIKRGICSFTEKARNAEAAGAVAVVITDDRIDRLSTMLGNVSGVTIPAMIVTQAGGEKLRENAGRACAIRIGELSAATVYAAAAVKRACTRAPTCNHRPLPVYI